MSAFDPDAFLASRQPSRAGGKSFDPDAFLATAAKARIVNGAKERAAADKQLLDSMGPAQRFLVGAGGGLLNIARNVQDIATPPGPEDARQAFGAPDPQRWASERSASGLIGTTGAGMVGNIVGETLPTLPVGAGVGSFAKAGLSFLPRAAGTLLPLAAEGASQASMMAEPGQRGLSMLLGGGLGLGLGALGKLGTSAAGKFGGIAQRAAAAAEALGLKKAAAATQEARSAAGIAATAAYKNATNIEEALKAGALALEDLAPEQLAQYQALLRERALKAAGGMASDAARKTAKGAEYAQALESQASRAEELAQQAKQSSFKKDAWDIFKMYGEPILGAAAGTAVGNHFEHGMLGGAGGMLGGLIFGRTRAGKVIRGRLSKPGNMISAARFMESLLGGGGKVVGASTPVPMAAASRSVPEFSVALPAYARAQGSEAGGQLADLIRSAYPMTANAQDD